MARYIVFEVNDVLDPNETRSHAWAEYEFNAAPGYGDPDRYVVLAECGDSSEGNALHLAKRVGRRERLGKLVECGQGEPTSRVLREEIAAAREEGPFRSYHVRRVEPPKGWRPRYDRLQVRVG